MTPPVSLLFGVHAHQPTDNFAEVLERADALCYRPFLETLDAHPRFRFAFHCSGPLYAILCERSPDDIRLLERMVARGQVELFGGGDAEPLLAAIPERDRRSQLRTFSDRLEARFGERPRGAWLTERAWESTVVSALADCGIEYVTVDDYHFLCTGREAAELDGYFSTEEGGQRLDLFPISEVLRYRIPFAPAADVVAYLESLGDAGGGAAAIYFDDIEKFGIWPETHEWVYGRRWLAEFLDGVLASKRIVTQTYREFRAAHRTRGLVYLPSTAYIEMNEWTLPAKAAARYSELVQRERDGGRYDDVKPFVRGGIWRNFLSRYPEANWLHKRMLGLSARLQSMPDARDDPALVALLHAAQANDAYWHGLFGGLYLPHLRRGIYRALLALEQALDRLRPRPARVLDDRDCDGVDELSLSNAALQAVLRDDGRGTIVELDSYALLQNFGDTLRRHAESYHRLIGADDRRDAPAEGIASAHDRLAYRHPIDAADIVPDPRGRALFVDSYEAAGGATTSITGYGLVDDTGEAPAAHFRATFAGIAADKRVALRDNRLQVSYVVSGGRPGRWIVELDLAMPSCDGIGGRFIADGTIRGGFGDDHALAGGRVVLDDTFLGGRVEVACTPPAQIVARPYRTVSQSEQGFEKIMQSVTLTLSWPLEAAEVAFGVALAIERGNA
ncbi:MAG TPA: alpha-amylase/4-alpha-glucanotransferase domain-containing protein [Casimicrobiaceae bacterium]